MSRSSQKPTVFSKVSVKGQTVLPREVRARLGIKPGDILRYRLTDDGILLDKAPADADPFASFLEWSSQADEKPMPSFERHRTPEAGRKCSESNQ
jgi:AbrB family looped-hinge helix DNA binding protein